MKEYNTPSIISDNVSRAIPALIAGLSVGKALAAGVTISYWNITAQKGYYRYEYAGTRTMYTVRGIISASHRTCLFMRFQLSFCSLLHAC